MKRFWIRVAEHARTAPEDDPDQALRLRRFFLALVSYALSSMLFLAYVVSGAMSLRGYLWVTAATVIINAAFYAAFRTGFNLRFREPSLTIHQMTGGIAMMLLGSYHVDEGRGGLLLMFVVIFLFGVFRLNTRQLMAMSAGTLAGHVGVLFALFHVRPQAVDLRVELLQLMALVILLPTFAVLAGVVSGMREKLSLTNRELGHAMEQIRAQAIRDELTGQYNRRHMMHLLRDEWEQAERNDGSLAVMMLDLDRFKLVNDEHGHLAGDRLIRAVADALGEELRSIDRLCRYGGEEFLVLVPGVDGRQAVQVAERLRRRVEHRCRRPGSTLPQTVSIGVACHQPGEGVIELLDRADRALYQAKAAGRNRVCLADDGPRRVVANGRD
ncbi:MAG: diguanylate cyclase [Ectothiorhodospiraceae bacterium]|nr:diguanylate cyclase [Ectothiorhodospiraceae bacterium]